MRTRPHRRDPFLVRRQGRRRLELRDAVPLLGRDAPEVELVGHGRGGCELGGHDLHPPPEIEGIIDRSDSYIRNARIKTVGKYQSCMDYTLLIICKWTRIYTQTESDRQSQDSIQSELIPAGGIESSSEHVSDN